MKHLDAVNEVDDSLLHERELFYKKSFNTYASNNLLEASNVLQAMLMKYPSGWFFDVPNVSFPHSSELMLKVYSYAVVIVVWLCY